MATEKPVAVAFDAGNLEPVAKKLREKFPNAAITICADNDHQHTRRTPEKRFLVPTPLGEKVVSGLCGHFSFIEYEFTRKMEQSLDDIAEGKAQYRTVIASAYDQLSREVQAFAKATGKVCEKCGKPMVHRVKKPPAL